MNRPYRLCGLLGAALCGVQLSAHAILVGPYTPDAFTLHLWHFDESSTPVVDYAPTGGTNLTSVANGATLGTASFAGFGSALNTYDGGPNGTNAVDKDAV
ncbi:MAG TPA: hypothetical protein VNZ22_07625, partial [Bacillota bacterium]|nr:hypothetical protein [Bacillota bacterium]